MMREATWINIGTDIREANNVNEALAISGLDYNVVKQNIYLPNGALVPKKFATVQEGTDNVFGVVGDNYELVQNRDAFEFIDGIIPEGLEFVKAGSTKDTVYIIAKLPEHYVLGDEFVPYIIFQNSHNGFSTLRAAICPLRIVCQNQFAMAFKKADNFISLRHSSSVHERMLEAQAVLTSAANYMDTFSKEAEELAMIKLSEAKQTMLINNFFAIPEDASQRKINNMMEKRDEFMVALNQEDNREYRGTAWGMMNAFADYVTHLNPKRRTELSEVNRFQTVTLNPQMMNNFRNEVLRIA